MQGKQQNVDLEDDDDEPMFWDELEARYGRPLTDQELRRELEDEYGATLSDEEFADELKALDSWRSLKEEWRIRESRWADEEARAQLVADDLHGQLCSPPLFESGSFDDALFEDWKASVNEIIKTRLDFDSLMKIIEQAESMGVKRQAQTKALRRHIENHALRDEIYAWADAHKTPNMSLDDAATALAGKVVPLKWRTCREHLTEWKKVRSAGKA